MMTRKLILNLIGIFAFGFCFIFAAYVGLPVDFNADHINNVQRATAVRYSELLRMTVNPFTPAWFYPAEGRMEYLRPLQFLLMKFFFETFHCSLIPVHIGAAIGHGILLVTFSVFIYLFSGSLLFCWLAAFLYTSFPSNFFMMTSVFAMDFQYAVSLLSITSLTIFGILTIHKIRRPVIRVFCFVGWIAALWLAIKLKSSEKVLPLIMGSFLLLRVPFSVKRIGWRRIIVLFLLLICMTPLVAPLKCFERWTPKETGSIDSVQMAPATEKDRTTFSFQLENLLQRTFFVWGGEFPFTTIWRRQIPRSFTENYGFFLGWFFWGGLLWLLWRFTFFRARSDPQKGIQGDEWREHAVWLILIWFAVTIAGFANGISVEDTRLLNFAYVPSIFLLFAIVAFFEDSYLVDAKRRLLFHVLLAGLVLYTAFSNFVVLGKLVGHFGGMQSSIVAAERAIFRDFFKVEPNELTLYQRHRELEDRAMVVDWYELPPTWLEDLKAKLEQEGKVYFLTRFEDSERLGALRELNYRVDLVGRYNLLDSPPIFFKVAKKAAESMRQVSGKKKTYEILTWQVTHP